MSDVESWPGFLEGCRAKANALSGSKDNRWSEQVHWTW